ncbi:putative meiotically up-regulated 71 protein [Botrytis fragariae]|uniref:Diphthine--ammonia ligase n=1 Tax=Botrytis fragariae TaxID=1964551 RepID=A0A8H6EN70_9HELO|nr:putative meiotically up-regulated 71 protein [Botrytis fragariae]KAF5878521.1 putative meiotically up-regulated 71 protein [Botrytis fragariae]
MSESLNVIALVSGGKDSFFSILHCIQHGHKIVALGNLHPPLTEPQTEESDGIHKDENDLNSFMYQTVGHTIIPLYEEALGIPLYRQAIVGSAVQTGTSYDHADLTSSGAEEWVEKKNNTDGDETESLVPLLQRIKDAHPEANALSTGAILSTYQRTRVESVAIRLGLVPLSFLWQYPILPPGMQISLLQDMQAVGLDARIIKVASGGLDESFLWENVASEKGMRRVERAMKRFSIDGDGAVLGEGGEFETLVVDGPSWLFKKRILVETEDTRIVREGGGSAWIQISKASLVDKESIESKEISCRVPALLDQRSSEILSALDKNDHSYDLSTSSTPGSGSLASPTWELKPSSNNGIEGGNMIHWTIIPESAPCSSILDEAKSVVESIKARLNQASLKTTDIVSTMIMLRSMEDFTTINKIYGTLFPHPNPPSRVTISCGSSMPLNTSLIIHLTLHIPSATSSPRKALHVQSRSYWAPANIGPYSQASSLPSSLSSSQTLTIAGQIPLIPHNMLLPTSSPSSSLPFHMSTILSLQHLLRIADATSIKWFTSACIYIPTSSPSPSSASILSKIAYQAWKHIHALPPQDSDHDSDAEPRDLWEEKFRYSNTAPLSTEHTTTAYPAHDILQTDAPTIPPFWTAEVDSLPRGSEVEWHAHVGVNNIETHEHRDNSLTTSSTRHTVLTFPYDAIPASDDLKDDYSNRGLIHLVYVDTSLVDVNKLLSAGWEGKGVIPCKSLWDGEGRRLSTVIVFWGDAR